jgi:hypothetical protein
MTLFAAALLTGCTRSASEDSLESLKRDPGRLRLVLAQCKQASDTERKCRAAAEAWRQRFFEDSHARPSDDTRAYEAFRP